MEGVGQHHNTNNNFKRAEGAGELIDIWVKEILIDEKVIFESGEKGNKC